MEKHIKNYLNKFYPDVISSGEYIPCEICGAPVTDFHHILYRSQAPKWFRDKPINILGTCNAHHEEIHQNPKKFNRKYLYLLHINFFNIGDYTDLLELNLLHESESDKI